MAAWVLPWVMRRKMFRHYPSKRINMWDLADLVGPRNRTAFRPYVKRARRAEEREAMAEAWTVARSFRDDERWDRWADCECECCRAPEPDQWPLPTSEPFTLLDHVR